MSMHWPAAIALLLLPAQTPPALDRSQINRLFQTATGPTTPEQDAELAAQIRSAFDAHGLPAIQSIGDSAAYKFVFLACTLGDLPFTRRVQQLAASAARARRIPADAAAYCKARLREQHARSEAERVPPDNPALRDQINRLFETDQSVRNQSDFDLARMEATDRALKPEIEAIFAAHGVPSYQTVGPEAAGHFVVLIQHQSPDLRRRALPKLRANVRKGQASPTSYAMMLDRSLSESGKPQIYGENLVCDAANPTLHIGPLHDPAHVNQRRAAIGLLPLELYAELVRAVSPNLCASAPTSPAAPAPPAARSTPPAIY